MLAGFVKDLRAGEADFAELAREHSEDSGSALKAANTIGLIQPPMCLRLEMH